MVGDATSPLVSTLVTVDLTDETIVSGTTTWADIKAIAMEPDFITD